MYSIPSNNIKTYVVPHSYRNSGTHLKYLCVKKEKLIVILKLHSLANDL